MKDFKPFEIGKKYLTRGGHIVECTHVYFAKNAAIFKKQNPDCYFSVWASTGKFKLNEENLEDIISKYQDDASVISLLKKARWEIENLQVKIAKGEPEGWEGSKRRLALKNEIDEVLKTCEEV